MGRRRTQRPPAPAVTGLRRSERCSRSSDRRAALYRRRSLGIALLLRVKSNTVRHRGRVAEQRITTEQAGALDTLLSAATNARRVVLSWNPGMLSDFLERHARRAEVVGGAPTYDGAPLSPIGPARHVVGSPVPATPRCSRYGLDLLDPKQPFVWRAVLRCGRRLPTPCSASGCRPASNSRCHRAG